MKKTIIQFKDKRSCILQVETKVLLFFTLFVSMITPSWQRFITLKCILFHFLPIFRLRNLVKVLCATFCISVTIQAFASKLCTCIKGHNLSPSAKIHYSDINFSRIFYPFLLTLARSAQGEQL